MNSFFPSDFSSPHACIKEQIFRCYFLQSVYEDWLVVQCGCPVFEEWRKQMFVAGRVGWPPSSIASSRGLQKMHLQWNWGNGQVISKVVLIWSSWNKRKQISHEILACCCPSRFWVQLQITDVRNFIGKTKMNVDVVRWHPKVDQHLWLIKTVESTTTQRFTFDSIRVPGYFQARIVQ